MCGVDIFSLHGKTALITGSTGHLGSSIARSFAAAGARVLINSRTSSSTTGLVSELSRMGHCVAPAQFDATSPQEIAAFAEKLNGEPVHIIVNNAYTGKTGDMQSTAVESYLASYNIAVMAAHRIVTTLLPNLRLAVAEHGDASVVNIASMYGIVSPDSRIYDRSQDVNSPAYGAAKAALLQWTRYAACELGKERIRVNAISPGAFPKNETQASNPQFIDRLSNKIPLGRIGRADEIRGPALFLASSAASFVNGANVVVDGGWTCW